jgi:hypothetical protein
MSAIVVPSIAVAATDDDKVDDLTMPSVEESSVSAGVSFFFFFSVSFGQRDDGDA